MRARLLILLIAWTGCSVRGRLPAPGQIGIAVKTTVRADVRVEAPPPPAPIVAVQNAPVVEFFGIPLGDAQDVVFVLDVSGSMQNFAQGRMAQIQVTPPPAQSPPLQDQPPAPAEPGPPGGATPPPPAPPPPDAPPGPQPGAPGDGQAPADPNAAQAPPQPTYVQPRKIDVAKAELADALSRLPAGTRMNVLFFNSGIEGYAAGLVPLDEAGRTSMLAFVGEVDAAGSTALAPAMRTAFLMNARRVVLLSDGLGNVGGNADAVLRDAREAMRGGVRIDTIGVGAGQHSSLLATLAGESGGLYQGL